MHLSLALWFAMGRPGVVSWSSRLETRMGSRDDSDVSPRRFHCILLLLIGFLTNRVVLGDASVGFDLLKADLTGLVFTNSVPPSRYLTNQIPLNGSGVALGDVDGDGRPDLFLAAYSGGSVLFRNLGQMKFTPITEAAFGKTTLSSLDGTGVVLADIDGDGDLDLLLNTLAGLSLLGTLKVTNPSKRGVLRSKVCTTLGLSTGRLVGS